MAPAAPTDTCVCGHAREAHEHLRRGTDCALCDCPRFRKDRSGSRATTALPRRSPADGLRMVPHPG